jgi:hypothetical protein
MLVAEEAVEIRVFNQRVLDNPRLADYLISREVK